jgi:hypothetical protein
MQKKIAAAATGGILSSPGKQNGNPGSKVKRKKMRLGRKTFLLLSILFCSLALAQAEDKFGVKVYDGAKYDADSTAIMAQIYVHGAACYRSSDALQKVIDFYSKLPGVTVVHTSDKWATFKLNGVTITLQNPWLDMKTGKHNTDTLISIVKN